MSEPRLIRTAAGPLYAVVSVPGSKSYSNRALPVAALADGVSTLTGVLDSEDTQVMMESLRRLGVPVDHDAAAGTAVVHGCSGRLPASSAELYLANSGTSIRFLAAVVATGSGRFVLDGSPRMRERPIGELLDSLHSLGVSAKAQFDNKCPPVVLETQGLREGVVTVAGDVSSQFLSALLLASPAAKGPVTIHVVGHLVSQPYIEMTLQTMRDFGVEVQRNDYAEFQIYPSPYRARTYAVEPDASAASYFFGAAAVVGGRATVPGLGSRSLQGDLGFVRAMERMGCRVEQTEDSTTVVGGPPRGIDIDMCDISDTAPTLAAVACFADGPTRIRNVAHMRVKECDRISAMATELQRAGIVVEEHDDGMTIHPGPIRPTTFATYNDHRMAMSLSLLGLRVAGIRIADPECTGKTYPAFFRDLEAATP